jgi:hypothetical protein
MEGARYCSLAIHVRHWIGGSGQSDPLNTTKGVSGSEVELEVEWPPPG